MLKKLNSVLYHDSTALANPGCYLCISSSSIVITGTGAGLGLYVGKNFVEAHGGTIWAESDGPDKGSRFIIELPLVNPNIQVGTSDQPSSSETA